MLVSIVVPCFNCEHTIQRTINSLFRQTYRNLEIILIDDGSTDKTAHIVDNLKQNDSRIVVKHIPNKGVSHARNVGINISQGSFITFVDSDDELEPNIIQQAIIAQKKIDADIVFFGHADITIKTSSTNRHDYSLVKPIDLTIAQHNETFFQTMFELERSRYLFSCWGKLIRKSWIADTRFETDINYGEDTTWILTLLKKKGRIIAIPDIGYLYHQSSQGLLNSFSPKKSESIVKAHQRQIQFYLWSQMPAEYQRFVQLRLTNDVFWALQTIKTVSVSVPLQKRMEFIKTLTDSPLRSMYLRNAKFASVGRWLKILFVINSDPLWLRYCARPKTLTDMN